MINDILSLIEVATIAINETTILEIKVTIRPFRSSLTTYLSRLMKVKESAKSVMHVQSFCFSLVKAIALYPPFRRYPRRSLSSLVALPPTIFGYAT